MCQCNCNPDCTCEAPGCINDVIPRPDAIQGIADPDPQVIENNETKDV